MDTTAPISFRHSKLLAALSAISPLVLVAGLIWWFFHGGSQLVERPVPPIEQISIRRVELKPGEFKLTIRNTGPMPADMTLVTVDEAIWKAEFSPSRHLERLQEATVRIPFDWVPSDPYKIELFTASGFSFEKEIPVAVAIVSPLTRSKVRLVHLALLGIVGGAPAILGCWMGGFSYSDIASAFFLAIGAGAVFQVVWAIGTQMMKTPEGNLFHLSNAAGLMLGMVVMWATALLVSA